MSEGHHNAQILDEERPAVGLFLDDHRGRLARTMPRLGLDPDQDRGLTPLHLLQRRRELERVARHDTVVVIGRRAKDVDEADVDRHIFGYTCGNDVSARDWQRGDTQWWRAKSADTFTAVGPWIETGLGPDRIPVVGRVNGKRVQRGHTGQLIHSVRACIAFISSVPPPL